MMSPAKAAAETVRRSGLFVSMGIKEREGRGIHHALWMLNEIQNKSVTGEKAHRWLGYAQAIVVATADLELDTIQKINARA